MGQTGSWKDACKQQYRDTLTQLEPAHDKLCTQPPIPNHQHDESLHTPTYTKSPTPDPITRLFRRRSYSSSSSKKPALAPFA